MTPYARMPMATLLVASGLTLISTAPAHADSDATGTGTVAWTDIGIYPRAEPSMSADKIGSLLVNGDTVYSACQTEAEPVYNGSQTVAVWDQLTDGTWLPNAFLDTGYASWTPGLPVCSDTTESSQSELFAVETPNAFFDRNATAAWGLRHAMDEPPLNEALVPGCTWFVSQALWAGGFPKDETWTAAGHHSKLYIRGSVTAWTADNLYRYLQERFNVSLQSMDFAANEVPDAEIGDVVAYDWDSDNTIDHLSLVTNLTGDYPEVSEWGIYGLIPDRSATQYQKRGWTWSEKNGKWLQEDNPDVTATLVHFNGGTILPTF